MRDRFGAHILAIGAALAVTTTGSACAQDTPGAAASDQVDTSAGLATIVVTAQRREENAQDIPVAVTAFDAETLAAQGINDVQQLARSVPGLNYDRSSQGATPFIRGVGVNSSVMGNEPSVATFIDDVYVPYNVAGFEFSAIQSVEVSRGPQGTLFGRNATGGVIQIKTRDPADVPEYEFGVSYGSYDKLSAQVYASVPLNEVLSFNVAATTSLQQDGWGRNLELAKDGFTEKTYGVRAKLKYRPDPDLSVILAYNRDYRKSDIGIAMRVVPGAVGYGNLVVEDAYPGIGFYDQVTNIDAYYRNVSDRGSLKIEKDLGFAALTSVTAYGDVRPYILSDVDASPTNRFQLDGPAKNTTFTQELRLASQGDGPFNWIGGVFYMHDKAVYLARYFGNAFTALNGTGSSNVDARQMTDSYSGFAEGSYEFATGTTVAAGIRYTSDRRKFSGFADWNFNDGTFARTGPFSDSETFNKLTYRLSLTQELSSDVRVYGAVSRGFKSGVYNLAAISPSPFPATTFAPPVKPEVLDAYSIGFKSELFNRTVRFNAEGFWYDYKNIQVTTLQTGGTLLLNGARAQIRGMEAELQIAPTQGLTFIASATYMKARFRDFPDGPTFFLVGPEATPIPIPDGCDFTAYPVQSGGNPLQQAGCNLAGNRMGHAPDFQANLMVSYTVPVGPDEANFNIGYTHTSSYYFEPDNLYLTRQPVTDVFNATVSYAFDNGLEIGVSGTNLTKEKYYSYIVESTTSGVKYSPASPREAKVFLRMKL